MEATKADTPVAHKRATAAAHGEPRNFLAAFLLVVNLGFMGINRLYTGESTMGWIRFGLFVGGFLLSPLIIGLPLLLAAYIWGIVDVFMVYHGPRTDVAGVPMVQTPRDLKVAKAFYIIFVIGTVLAVLFLLMMVVFSLFLGAGAMEWLRSSDSSTPPYPYHPY